MASLELPEHAYSFIRLLATTEPAPVSIWLIGSRANGRATTASDTDLLVFGSMALLRALASMPPPPVGIDCLVVFDGNHYKDPWQVKNGSLTCLEWRPVNDTLSSYVGLKWTPDEESSDESLGNMVQLQEHAVRIWP